MRLTAWIWLTAATDGAIVWLVWPLLVLLTDASASIESTPHVANDIFSDLRDTISPVGLSCLLFAGIAATCGLKMLFQVLRRRSAAQLQWQARQEWMHQLMSKYLYADYRQLAHRRLGKLLDSLIVETRQGALCLFELVECAGKAAQFICLIGVLLLVNAPLAVMFFIFAGCGVLCLVPVWRRLVVPLGQQHVELNQACKGIAAENISLFADIKAFGIEEQRLREFDRRAEDLADVMVRQTTLHSIPQPLGEVLMVVVLLICFAASSIFELEAASMIPLFGFGLVALRRLLSLGTAIAAHLVTIGGTVSALAHVHQLMAADDDRRQSSPGCAASRAVEEIVLQGVTFAHPGQSPVIRDVNLTLPPRSATAVVGPSGAGKSTMAHLLLGFLEPTSGSILVDGRELQTIDAWEWRRQIGYVSQDPVLFNTSILENIALGDSSADHPRIEEACRLAGADDFIRRLPDGWETVVGERGLRLSAGERQRLAVARALVRDPQVLIFDEATSALDSASARLIERTVEMLRGHKTILFITHRITSLTFVDTIVRVADGCIHPVVCAAELPAGTRAEDALQKVA